MRHFSVLKLILLQNIFLSSFFPTRTKEIFRTPKEYFLCFTDFFSDEIQQAYLNVKKVDFFRMRKS